MSVAGTLADFKMTIVMMMLALGIWGIASTETDVSSLKLKKKKVIHLEA